MAENDMVFLDFPSGWKKLKEQPLPSAPKDLLQFLNSVPVSQEELLRGRPVSKMFTIPEDLLSL